MKPAIIITDADGRQWMKSQKGYSLVFGCTPFCPIHFAGHIFPAGNFKKKKK